MDNLNNVEPYANEIEKESQEIDEFLSRLPKTHIKRFNYIEGLSLEKNLENALQDFDSNQTTELTLLFRPATLAGQTHPVLINLVKVGNQIEIYLDDSLPSSTFEKTEKKLQKISKIHNYKFYSRDFGKSISKNKDKLTIKDMKHVIFHGKTSSHYSVLYLAELWKENPEKMRLSIVEKRTDPKIMEFSDNIRKIKYYSTSHNKELSDLVSAYEKEFSEKKQLKMFEIIRKINKNLLDKYDSSMQNLLIQKIIEASKLKKINALLGKNKTEISQYLSKQNEQKNLIDPTKTSSIVNKEIEITAKELFLNHYQEFTKVIEEKMPDELVEDYALITYHSNLFREKLESIRKKCLSPSYIETMQAIENQIDEYLEKSSSDSMMNKEEVQISTLLLDFKNKIKQKYSFINLAENLLYSMQKNSSILEDLNKYNESKKAFIDIYFRLFSLANKNNITSFTFLGEYLFNLENEKFKDIFYSLNIKDLIPQLYDLNTLINKLYNEDDFYKISFLINHCEKPYLNLLLNNYLELNKKQEMNDLNIFFEILSMLPTSDNQFLIKFLENNKKIFFPTISKIIEHTEDIKDKNALYDLLNSVGKNYIFSLIKDDYQSFFKNIFQNSNPDLTDTIFYVLGKDILENLEDQIKIHLEEHEVDDDQIMSFFCNLFDEENFHIDLNKFIQSPTPSVNQSNELEDKKYTNIGEIYMDKLKKTYKKMQKNNASQIHHEYNPQLFKNDSLSDKNLADIITRSKIDAPLKGVIEATNEKFYEGSLKKLVEEADREIPQSP